MIIKLRCSCGSELELDTDDTLSMSEAMLIQKEWREEHVGCIEQTESCWDGPENPKPIKQYIAWETQSGIVLLTEYKDGSFWIRDRLASIPSRASNIPLTFYR